MLEFMGGKYVVEVVIPRRIERAFPIERRYEGGCFPCFGIVGTQNKRSSRTVGNSRAEQRQHSLAESRHSYRTPPAGRCAFVHALPHEFGIRRTQKRIYEKFIVHVYRKPCLSSFASDYPAVTVDYVPDALRRIGSASRVVATHLSHLTKTRPFARNPIISGDREGSRFAVIFRHRITYAFV